MWVKPACCVSKISSDGGCESKETGVGMEERLLSVGARSFFLAASRLDFEILKFLILSIFSVPVTWFLVFRYSLICYVTPVSIFV